MRGTFLGWLLFVYATFIGQYTCANILDVTCINFNPIYDPDSTASFAAILNGADITSELSFQRSVDLDSGVRSSSWCSQGEDNLTLCGLPQGSTIDSTGKVTFQNTAADKFGVYGCRAERYNWTTESQTILIRVDAHFIPEYFTVTVSLDEDVRLEMNDGSSGGSGLLLWKLNQESGGQTDLTSDLSGNELYISKANRDTHAGIHHYYYADQPDQGGLVRLIVRACLDNLWGSGCQYTCPTCYNGGVCDDVTGRCICPPGFSGDHCGTACPGGMFGQDCSGSCSTLESGRTNCRGAVFCLSDPYGCSCAAGWTGLSCDQGCPTGMYGAGCTQTCHCESSGSCDLATGACSNGCEDGWTGDQCQVTIVDIIALLRGAGVDDTTTHFLGLFMIGDNSVTSDASLKYYIGREVDTGPGETGHGASLQIDSGAMTTDWTDTGLPPDTTFNKYTTTAQHSYRSFISTGGDARVGAYRMSINYKGFTERNTLLNEYRGDMNSEVWPDKLTTTVGVGETVTLNVSTSVDTALLRWRHNGGSVITEWNGMTSVTINDVRKSDDGIYECHVSNNRETGKHAILRLIVRGCPSAKFGFNCSQDCPVCYAGGVCHDVTGECVCRAGFKGDKCQTPCSNNLWGRTCTVKCSTGGTCVSRLFSPPNPVGIACMNGFSGNRCQTACSGNKFGANCELDCNCDGGTCSHNNACPSGQCTSDYEGPYCQTLSANLLCQPGYFGTLCKYPCHCDGGVNCERTTGYCPNDDCAEGWAGSDCQQALPRLMETPIVTDITNDSVLIVWNAWTDGYDYGNGPVHSYQIDYSWTDDTGIEGSEEPVNITGDSTAFITGLFGFRDYEFYVSVRREVEDQIVPGVRSGPLTAKTLCGAPLLAPEIQSTTVDGFDNITVIWMIPQVPSSSWLQCDSSVYSYRLTYWPIDDPTDSIILPVEGSEDIREQPIDGLEPCTEYQFSVVVVNSIDLTGPADESTATTDKISPEPVNNTDVTSESYNHLNITWSKPFSQCGDPTYNVSRAVLLIDQCDDSMANSVTWRKTEATSIEYTDLLPYSTYEFTIMASVDGYDAEDLLRFTYNSTESNPTAPPEGLTVDATMKTELHYDWSIPACGGRNGDISYYYEFHDALGNKEGSDNTTETSLPFTSLQHWALYNFTVCSQTIVGLGPCISEQTRTLPSEPTMPLNVASNAELTNQTYTIITWDEPTSFNGLFERYEIQKDEDAIVQVEERMYQYSDLEPDTEYMIRVRAVSNGGDSVWAPVDVTTIPIPLPETPLAPVMTDRSTTSISIEFGHVDDTELGIYKISSYDLSAVDGQTTGDGELMSITNLTSPIAVVIGDLSPGTEYYIKVRAVNEGGTGDWSEILTESTEAETNIGLIVGTSVCVPIILIILISSGFMLYKKRREAPPTPPREFDLEENDNNGGPCNPIITTTTVSPTPKVKPAIKQRPAQYQPILVSNLAKFIKVRRISPEGFEKEYQTLLHLSDEGCIGNNPENKPKNRYKNVLTYDEHRVVLNKQPTEPGADYINATFIDGYKKENAYIASQGPNKASLDDFWQMVYEQKTATIVMLTNLVENSKIKCLEYWPASGKHQDYGELEIAGREVEYHGSYVLRKFGVGKSGRSPHQVSQYHYTIWPDMGVPDSSQPLIDFRDVVKTANPTDAGPIIVHCSAGAGRTGTFITIDSMMEMIDAEQKIDVFKFVNEMRKRRAYMVQVKPQYEFIYETLLQWSMCERVSFNIIDLQATVKSWRTEDATTGKTEMLTQFEVLEYMAPKESIGSNQRGSMLENSKKNRYPDLVPVDKFQPLLMTTGDGVDDNEYINASFFDVKGRTNAHVCAQCPLMSTIGDFWRLIWDYDIHTVIHLNEMDSTCGQYWPDDDKTNFGSFTIELLSSKNLTETLIERELKVTTPKKKGERKISQFQYMGWPKDLLVPSSKMEFLELLMQVDNNNASEKRFLIVCMDGVGASPTCLAAIAAMENTKEDKTVDVFSAVKRLRKSRPGVVDKLERYNFCFDVLAAYQDSVQTYANYM